MVMKALHTASIVSTVMTLLLLLGQSLLFPDWALPLWERTLVFLLLSYLASFLLALWLGKKQQEAEKKDKKSGEP